MKAFCTETKENFGSTENVYMQQNAYRLSNCYREFRSNLRHIQKKVRDIDGGYVELG